MKYRYQFSIYRHFLKYWSNIDAFCENIDIDKILISFFLKILISVSISIRTFWVKNHFFKRFKTFSCFFDEMSISSKYWYEYFKNMNISKNIDKEILKILISVLISIRTIWKISILIWSFLKILISISIWTFLKILISIRDFWKNIDIDKIYYWLEFSISNRATKYRSR